MQQIFVYGKETIPYSVLFSARRTLGIKVYPSGEVVLLAPEGTPEEVIEQKLHKRAPWILRQQAYFKNFGFGVRKNGMSAESRTTIWESSSCSGCWKEKPTASVTKVAASRWYAPPRTGPGS